jgi:hypothetical protein
MATDADDGMPFFSQIERISSAGRSTSLVIAALEKVRVPAEPI